MNVTANDAVRQTIADVRRRWQRLMRRQTAARIASGAAVAWLGAWVAAWLAPGGPLMVAGAALIAALATLVWTLWVLRRRPALPSAARLARLVEERYPDLDDRLVTAVHAWSRPDAEHPFAARVQADAERRLAAVSVDQVIAPSVLRRAAAVAVGSVAALLAVGLLWVEPGHRALQAVALQLFPGWYPLLVTPGDARVKPGEPFIIGAEAVAPFGRIVPTLHVRVGDEERGVPMSGDGEERYAWRFESVPASFSYQVSAGGRRSDRYRVTLLQHPRVRRVDLHYEFPAYTRLPSRVDEDGGDIYAPAGTRVRVSVHATKPLASGALIMAGGERIDLRPAGDTRGEAEMTVRADGAYRIALADADGLASAGETEYFIRVLNDRPPTVRILRPARDRQVTPLEEVTIEARADDDYGIEALELVYSVRGARERVVSLSRGQRLPSATGRRTLFLEDLEVEPGDFVTYYARARDIGRGKAASEARSDIFFLEVTPFEEEFAAAQSQAMSGSGDSAVDTLVAAQKDIIVATWKLERRSGAGRSSADIQAVGRAQGELKQRAAAAQMLSGPARRRSGPLGRLPDPVAAEPSPMMKAVEAMARAEGRLMAGNTAQAIPPEMEALNHLLKAQADVRRREVARQQAGAGAGGNRADQDLSSLFDRELRRQQQTNYETPRSTEERRASTDEDVLERVRELARRQEQIAREHEDLLREGDRLTEEERRRQLERLAREQTELRRLAEQAAQQTGTPSPSPSGQEAGRARAGSQLREASEDMRRAAGNLRRDAPEEARTRAQRALDRLRSLERSMDGGQPDEQRRALGDLQLEARQLAERQRRLAEQASGAATDPDPSASRRRLATEQTRVAERAGKLRERVRELAAGAGAESSGTPPPDAEASAARVTAREAARELERQRLAERMAETARAFREASAGQSAATAADRHSREMQELARGMEGVADRLEPPPAGADAEQQRIAEELSAARRLRSELSALGQRIDDLQRGREAGSPGQARSGGAAQPSASGSDAGADLERLQSEYAEKAREVARLGRADAGRPGGGMSTPEGQLATPSAPGTEAFKQDFSRWEALHREVTLRVERLEASLSQQLLERAARERVRAGPDDRAPDAYERAVERYFRSLADQSAAP